MRFFVDSNNPSEIADFKELGIISGVFTNRTLMAKAKKDFEKTIKEICAIVEGPVFAHIIGTTAVEMVEEGEAMATWGNNIVVGIPMCREGLKAVDGLAQKGIETAVSFIFNPNQALLAASVGATYICPNVGGLDDLSSDGLDVLADICEIYGFRGMGTEVIAMAIRHPGHVFEAVRAGADIVAVPANVLNGIIDHPLSKAGIAENMADWRRTQH